VLFLKKKKPLLKDLIPNNFTDIHSHLLPGIDDGAQEFDDTVYLIDQLQSFGFSKFVTTPHTFTGFWDNTMEGILKKEAETKAKLNEKGLSCNLSAASEYLLDHHFLSLVQKKEILTVKDNYVLVEMSYLNAPIHLYDILFEIQVAGYKPILAHPERYLFYHKNLGEYEKLKNAGCSLQLNLLSTVGYYGKSVTEIAEKLMERDLIDFVGSDVHHRKHIESFEKAILIKNSSKLSDCIIKNEFFT
jgi:protein-tyrosine phosphatase